MIREALHKEGRVRTSALAAKTGKSRAYVHRILKQMQDAGEVVLVGKTNQAEYVPAATVDRLVFERTYTTAGLDESQVFQSIEHETTLFANVPENTFRIVRYAFSEMLNNAIDHARAKRVHVRMERDKRAIRFWIIDRGIGIFKNVRQRWKLADTGEAIERLLKGKQTTAPKAHSGEGIFFTSKLADNMTIASEKTQIVFDAAKHDISVMPTSPTKGTAVFFEVNIKTTKQITKVFRQYSSEDFDFDTTEIFVKLYQRGTEFVSRSEAKRLLSELDAFETVILDFAHVTHIGQGFADEIFRVWKAAHPQKKVVAVNTTSEVQFMISRAKKRAEEK